MGAKRVLVVGLGNMGLSHALAYARIEGYEIAGLCTRNIEAMELPAALQGAPRHHDRCAFVVISPALPSSSR